MRKREGKMRRRERRWCHVLWAGKAAFVQTLHKTPRNALHFSRQYRCLIICFSFSFAKLYRIHRICFTLNLINRKSRTFRGSLCSTLVWNVPLCTDINVSCCTWNKSTPSKGNSCPDCGQFLWTTTRMVFIKRRTGGRSYQRSTLLTHGWGKIKSEMGTCTLRLCYYADTMLTTFLAFV